MRVPDKDEASALVSRDVGARLWTGVSATSNAAAGQESYVSALKLLQKPMHPAACRVEHTRDNELCRSERAIKALVLQRGMSIKIRRLCNSERSTCNDCSDLSD